MTAYAFDTLKAADELIAAGIDSKHARAITATMRDAVTEGVATKADVAKLEGDIADVKSDVAKTNGRLDVLKAEISSIEWVLGFLATVVLLMAGRLFGAF